MIECAEGMEKTGWEVELLGPDIFGGESIGINAYRVALENYLLKVADSYDVIEYEHNRICSPRNLFSNKPLMVGRVSIFTHRDDLPPIPRFPGFKRAISRRIRSFLERDKILHEVELTKKSIINAELLNVANEDDRKQMIRLGVNPARIVVLPYGLTEESRFTFNDIKSESPSVPRIVFIGTFDERKGGVDLPKIFKYIQKCLPQTKFRLLGTAGMFQTEDQVRSFFPTEIQENLEVIPRYCPEELNKYLADCSIGVFPSYFESFGFGVLEMLAASIPVIAYRAPGPSMMLKDELMVGNGDWKGISEKAVKLINNSEEHHKQRLVAKEISQRFNWDLIAKETGEFYLKKLDEKKSL